MSEVPERDEDEAEPRSMSFLAAAAWTVALVVAMSLAVRITEAARPGAVNDLVNDTACEVLAYSLLLFAMVRVYAPTSPMRVALGFGAASPLHVLLAAIAGAGLAPGMSVVDEIMTKYFPQSEEETEGLAKLLTATTVGSRVALVATLVVALPIVEELFFRGILFGGLRKGRTLVVGILATPLFYTTYIMAGQLSPRFLVTTFALALVLAWVRAETGTVLASMAAHVAVQAVQIAPLIRTGDPSADFSFPRTWVIGGVAAAVVALALVRATRATRHHPPS